MGDGDTQHHPECCRCRVFVSAAGRIGKIRLLGDLQHSTRIAFIEFIDAEAAMAAVNCSGALLGEWQGAQGAEWCI